MDEGEAGKEKQIGHVKELYFLLRAVEGFKQTDDKNYIKGK